MFATGSDAVAVYYLLYPSTKSIRRMRKAMTHCFLRFGWQWSSAMYDEGSPPKCSSDHCPHCRSPNLMTHQATRLEALAIRTLPCGRLSMGGKLP